MGPLGHQGVVHASSFVGTLFECRGSWPGNGGAKLCLTPFYDDIVWRRHREAETGVKLATRNDVASTSFFFFVERKENQSRHPFFSVFVVVVGCNDISKPQRLPNSLIHAEHHVVLDSLGFMNLPMYISCPHTNYMPVCDKESESWVLCSQRGPHMPYSVQDTSPHGVLRGSRF